MEQTTVSQIQSCDPVFETEVVDVRPLREITTTSKEWIPLAIAAGVGVGVFFLLGRFRKPLVGFTILSRFLSR